MEDLKALEISLEFDEIKKQYKKMALKHHPDRGGDPESHQGRAAPGGRRRRGCRYGARRRSRRWRAEAPQWL